MNRRSFFATLAGAAAAAKALALMKVPAPAVIAAPPEIIDPVKATAWLRLLRSAHHERPGSAPRTRSEWQGPGAPLLYDALVRKAGVLDLNLKLFPVEIYNRMGEVDAMIYYDNDALISALVLDSEIPALGSMMRRLPIEFLLSEFEFPRVPVAPAFHLRQNSIEFVT